MSDTRTSSVLALDFPVDTTAHLLKSVSKVDLLAKQGILNGLGLNQVLHSLDTAIAALAEAFAAPTLATVGTAGATTVKYACVPVYPIATADTFHQVNTLPGQPPTGRGPASALGVQGYRQKRYCPPPAPTAIATANATLNGTNYVTVTAPAVVHIAGVTFDILKYNAAGTLLGALALGVAPGAVVNDQGQALTTTYTPPNAHEVGYDAAYNSGTRIDAPLTAQLSRETGYDANSTAGLGAINA